MRQTERIYSEVDPSLFPMNIPKMKLSVIKEYALLAKSKLNGKTI